jgi:hypothetical protein
MPHRGMLFEAEIALKGETMGQAGNSHRRASLDDKKLRAAGRQDEQKIGGRRDRDFPDVPSSVGGAFGAGARPGTSHSRGGGGGGGSHSQPKD